MTVKMPPGRTIFILSVAWVLLFNPCYARGDMKTQNLIHATGLDGVAVLAMPRSLYPRAAPLDRQLLRAVACVESTEGSGYAEILAEGAERIMTPAELQAAHLFFQSSLGIKYGSLTIWQARADLGLKEDLPVPTFTTQEEEKIAAFLKTSAGIKLSAAKLLTAPHVANRLYEYTLKVINGCK